MIRSLRLDSVASQGKDAEAENDFEQLHLLNPKGIRNLERLIDEARRQRQW